MLNNLHEAKKNQKIAEKIRATTTTDIFNVTKNIDLKNRANIISQTSKYI